MNRESCCISISHLLRIQQQVTVLLASFTLVFRKSKLWLLASPASAFFPTQDPHTLILHKADNFLVLLLYCRAFHERSSMKIIERSTEWGKDK